MNMQEIKRVLDHGFVRIVDVMGNDRSVVNAARISYSSACDHEEINGEQVEKDRKLINYLMKNRHTSPFEMCEIKFHVKVPIFVARQWLRHRTANVNEISARYTKLPYEFYVPEKENINPQSSNNRQGRDLTRSFSTFLVDSIQGQIKTHSEDSHVMYDDLLYKNISRELARTVLPLNQYTEFYWKIDLHNLLHFLKLRMDGHSQYETRCYANTIAEYVRQWVPMTWEAFETYTLNSVQFSKKEMDVLKKWLNHEEMTQETSGLSKREYRELKEVFEK
ncbi:FAD-dependent thymidylate synthase [Heterosigma akashiwo virus 01]|jgi:thymidylate synthase (FAD)|uniref:FAD-dependent thymidylate synthase n=1 Tax=Heterosigma akashiwo virus 01 TaxID=97195 RepID=A0A1C9C5C1_HAV01|nr:thymidylate synthase [Heterosigma akashiwo virus 01]AOM63484.1 FAD-dependent thymidylate synthase [Heterosigma akashiwo virus 01]